MARLRRLADEGELLVLRVDADFEKVLADYRTGPRTPESFHALMVQVEAIDHNRAKGEWMHWYYEKRG